MRDPNDIPPPPPVQMAVRVPAALKTLIDAQCKKEDRGLQNLVVRALKLYLRRANRKATEQIVGDAIRGLEEARAEKNQAREADLAERIREAKADRKAAKRATRLSPGQKAATRNRRT
jgi:hypothetical protein